MTGSGGVREIASPLLCPVSRPRILPGPFLVAGLGRAGGAAVEALVRVVPRESIWAWDARTDREMHRRKLKLDAEGIRTWLGAPPGRIQIRRVRSVVKSPGLSFHSAVIQRARANGLEIVDELELGWRLSDAPVVAVTGTNGKSTVAGLITALLAASGTRVELAGNTEFGPPLSAVSVRTDWIVCEVSSFQLEGCHKLLPEIGVFTNLTPDHLGRHRSMATYARCKRSLFIRDGQPLPHAVVNIDAEFGRQLAAEIDELGGHVIRVGHSPASDYRVESVRWGLRQSVTNVQTPSGPVEITTTLPGAYNASNLVAALATGDLLAVDRSVSLQALSAFQGVPGRFEHLDAGQPFDVIVDFAQTPDAFEQFFRAVRIGMRSEARLTTVLGLGGRPGTRMWEVGRIAREHSDRLVLTTCGSWGFPPLPCLRDLLVGARTAAGGELNTILDRRRAIAYALRSADSGDVIAIPGRGATTHMLYDRRGRDVPFDDRNVALELLHQVVPARRRERCSNGEIRISQTPELIGPSR